MSEIIDPKKDEEFEEPQPPQQLQQPPPPQQEIDLDEQLRLKKIELKRKLEQPQDQQEQQEQQPIQPIFELTDEEKRNQILKDTFINFSELKQYCSGPSIINNDKVEKFYKGSKWSPDGTCLLSVSEDKFIRLFEIPFNTVSTSIVEQEDEEIKKVENEILHVEKAVFEIKEFESIYDYCWYPGMNSNNPTSCCFITSSKEYPITLWDAFNGTKRCTYKPYKDVDDLESAYSIQFNSNGNKIYGGFKKSIKIFDIDRPGDNYQEIKTTFKRKTLKSKKNKHGSNNNEDQINLSGIISSIAFDKLSMNGLFAASTYNGNIGLFDERIDQIIDIIPDPILDSCNDNNMELNLKMGITQIMFSPRDSNYLFASYRKSNYIIGWDIRNTVSQQVYQLYRPLDNHQRLQFDIDPISSRYLSTGTQQGNLLIYDLYNNGQLISETNHSTTSLNSSTFHPFLPHISLTFGQRQFNLITSSKEQDQQQPPNNNNEHLSFSILKY